MGDRSNIVVRYGGVLEEAEHQVCLYGHWMGESYIHILANALDRGRQRWNDPAYLARIIFCEMIRDCGENLIGTTGFGISQELRDNDYPILIVDTDRQLVYCENEYTNARSTFKTFTEFVEQYGTQNGSSSSTSGKSSSTSPAEAGNAS